MAGNKSNALLLLLTGALVIITCLQVYWLSNAYEVKYEEFERNINNALAETIKELEGKEEQRLKNDHPERKVATEHVAGGATDEADRAEKENRHILSARDERLKQQLTVILKSRLDKWGILNPAYVVASRDGDTLCKFGISGSSIEGSAKRGYWLRDHSLAHINQYMSGLKRNLHHYGYAFAGGTSFSHIRVDLYAGDVEKQVFARLFVFFGLSILFTLLIVVIYGISIRTVLKQQRAINLRNDLFNNLTHELKTPISTIYIAANALSDPDVLKHEELVRNYTGLIKQEDKKLLRQVESVLELSKSERESFTMDYSDADLSVMIKEVIGRFSEIIHERNGRILYHPDPSGDYKVKVDHIHFANALGCLIDNAVKYAETDPVVEVCIKREGDHFFVSVADNGVGISREHAAHVFDKFYRVPGPAGKVRGFGIGLSYARNIVLAHKGKIWFESTKGGGSIFHIKIPA